MWTIKLSDTNECKKLKKVLVVYEVHLPDKGPSKPAVGKHFIV